MEYRRLDAAAEGPAYANQLGRILGKLNQHLTVDETDTPPHLSGGVLELLDPADAEGPELCYARLYGGGRRPCPSVGHTFRERPETEIRMARETRYFEEAVLPAARDAEDVIGHIQQLAIEPQPLAYNGLLAGLLLKRNGTLTRDQSEWTNVRLRVSNEACLKHMYMARHFASGRTLLAAACVELPEGVAQRPLVGWRLGQIEQVVDEEISGAQSREPLRTAKLIGRLLLGRNRA